MYKIFFHCCRYDPHYVQKVKSSGRTSVNIWGVITKNGLGPLRRISGRFCAEAYLEIIDQELLPHLLDGPFTDGCFYLQHDLSPVHAARAVKEHLEQLGIMTLSWPPQGADLNIIENVWGILKSNLSKMSLHDASADGLWEAVKSAWDALKDDVDLVPALFDSLPRRIAGVAQSGGEFQRY